MIPVGVMVWCRRRRVESGNPEGRGPAGADPATSPGGCLAVRAGAGAVCAVGSARGFAQERGLAPSLQGAEGGVGSGGRSSASGATALVLGSTGFAGRYLVNALGRTGTRLVLPVR